MNRLNVVNRRLNILVILMLVFLGIFMIIFLRFSFLSKEAGEKTYYIHAFYTDGKIVPNYMVNESDLRIKIDSLYKTEKISHVVISICNNTIEDTDTKEPSLNRVDTNNEYYGDGVMGKPEIHTDPQ